MKMRMGVEKILRTLGEVEVAWFGMASPALRSLLHFHLSFSKLCEDGMR